MSQNDLNIANQGFPSFRSDLNDALQALGSNSSGASSPATTYAGQFWYDSTNNVVKFRNEANSAWIDPPIAGLATSLSDFGVTASAAELNKMDGVLATTTEINYIDGVTSNIQTQLGTKMPISGGTFTGNITRGGTVISDGAISDTGDFTIDVAGDIILDADGGDIFLDDGGTRFAKFTNDSSSLQIKSEVSDKDIIFKGNDGGSAITALTLDMSAAGEATFNSDVNAPNFNTTSDATLKTNVETIGGSLKAVKSLRGVTFDWIKGGASEVGVIAQEVEAVIPHLVSTNDEGIKSVKYGNMVAVLIEAMKEQQAQIDELKTKLNG